MSYFFRTLHSFLKDIRFWRDARVVEEARLESVYTPKAYRGFESRFLRRQSRMEFRLKKSRTLEGNKKEERFINKQLKNNKKENY